MILAQLLLFAALNCPQQAPAVDPKAAPGPDEGWQVLDRVLQIVNEEMLTSRALLHDMVRENHRHPFANESEAREAQRRLFDERVKIALQVQAGQDLGLDPAQVDRQVKNVLEREKEDRQGSAGMAAFLKDQDMTLFEAQDWVRDRIYAELWRNHVTGAGPVAEKRQSRDRYVRPGYMRYDYRRCLEHPELLRQIGGKAQAVVLQQLFLDPQAAGGEVQGRTLADELRRRIVDGEDMGDLVERYDATTQSKGKKGILEVPVESRLIQLDPAAGAFVAEAKPGDVSEVLPYKFKDRTYLRIVRLVERTLAVVPDLDAPEVQKKLSGRAQTDLADWRREEAYRVLYRASYVWPSELVQR